MIFHVLFFATLLAISIHLWRTRAAGWHAARLVKVSLFYFLCIMWGFGGVTGALPHILFPDYVAGYIGWEPGSPFQLELGFASLGSSILGILCIWFRGWFWLAPVVSKSVFLLGAATVHIQEILAHGNLAAGNAGPVLFYDVAAPILVCTLFIAHVKLGGIENTA